MSTDHGISTMHMLMASALSVAGITTDTAPGAGLAMMHRVMHGDPVPPDYWPELQRVTDLLRELIDTLEEAA